MLITKCHSIAKFELRKCNRCLQGNKKKKTIKLNYNVNFNKQ